MICVYIHYVRHLTSDSKGTDKALETYFKVLETYFTFYLYKV